MNQSGIYNFIDWSKGTDAQIQEALNDVATKGTLRSRQTVSAARKVRGGAAPVENNHGGKRKNSGRKPRVKASDDT
jgi:hypothetical protein